MFKGSVCVRILSDGSHWVLLDMDYLLTFNPKSEMLSSLSHV